MIRRQILEWAVVIVPIVIILTALVCALLALNIPTPDQS